VKEVVMTTLVKEKVREVHPPMREVPPTPPPRARKSIWPFVAFAVIALIGLGAFLMLQPQQTAEVLETSAVDPWVEGRMRAEAGAVEPLPVDPWVEGRMGAEAGAVEPLPVDPWVEGRMGAEAG
jgi:hypothetical protein